MKKHNSSDPVTYIVLALLALSLLIAAIEQSVQTLWTILAPHLFWVVTFLVLVVVVVAVMFVSHLKNRGNGFRYR